MPPSFVCGLHSVRSAALAFVFTACLCFCRVVNLPLVSRRCCEVFSPRGTGFVRFFQPSRQGVESWRHQPCTTGVTIQCATRVVLFRTVELRAPPVLSLLAFVSLSVRLLACLCVCSLRLSVWFCCLLRVFVCFAFSSLLWSFVCLPAHFFCSLIFVVSSFLSASAYRAPRHFGRRI